MVGTVTCRMGEYTLHRVIRIRWGWIVWQLAGE